MTPQAAPTTPPEQTGEAPKPRVIPVLLPHGVCGAGCPLCPPVADTEAIAARMPGPDDVTAAMRRYAPYVGRGARDPDPAGDGGRTLLAFYGGPLAALSHPLRARLLDAGEREFRSSRIDGIRLVCDLPRLLRAPLGEWRVRGIRSIEIPLLSMHRDVLRIWGSEDHPALVERALQKTSWLGLEVGLQIMPGLPGDTHERSVQTARVLAELGPSYVRILPALALEGTRLERWWRDRSWTPMSLAQAIETSAEMVRLFRSRGIPVARVGLQPEFDLLRGPRVLEGPYHPSLRHRVESALFRRQALDLARGRPFEQVLTLRFHPADESYVRGPENGTLGELRRRFRFRRIELVPDASLTRGALAPWSES